MRARITTAKKRTTISISVATHTLGRKLAAMERRDFSGMLENAIEERWRAKHPVKEKAA
jgi:siroheme synthase (precorrin-2 oxidase/ferrochelatase)